MNPTRKIQLLLPQDSTGLTDFTRVECCDETIHKKGFSTEMDRRSFLLTIGAGALATLAMQVPIKAGTAPNPNFDVNVPPDKKLKPEWVKALFERGTPEVFKGDELKNIRMPIAGIGSGHVYLSGEGHLTEWRFNDNPINGTNRFILRTVKADKTETHHLDRGNFPEMTFRGEYPIAKLDYANSAIPVKVALEVFSPFIPLNADDSGLPATVFDFTLKNTADAPVEATLIGALPNAICLNSRFSVPGTRRNQITYGPEMSTLDFSAEPLAADSNASSARPEIIFEDWTHDTFQGWTVEGTAFGSGPTERAVIEKKLGKLGGKSPRVVNSYFPTLSNAATGKLTSAPFTVERHYINIWMGGGDLVGKSCVNLVVDGKIVQSQTGARDNKLSLHFFDVREFDGKQATLEIVDASGDEWCQIGVDRISFSDLPGDGTPMAQLSDYGTMTLALLGKSADFGMARGSIGFGGQPTDAASESLPEALFGSLGRTVNLKPGESARVTFLITWHFPNLKMDKLGDVGRYYAKKFKSSHAVASYVAENFQKLAGATRLWRDTWYDSTLPYWFLDRTFLNVSTLATSGCYRFADGRFYAWEGGTGCCAGTCTHVWQYAHSMSRVFPELERDTRERVDLGISLNPETGVSGFRGEFDKSLAVDGQTGTIMRIYREHQMSPDDSFLKRNWEKIKLIYKPLFALDADEDGILEGAQMNTLDRAWFGQISWMSSMYVGALRAGEQMAIEMGDGAFAAQCRKIAENGTKNITERLFNGEYFVNIVDPKNLNTVNSGRGSHIDQVYGQSWAFQIGLPRVLPEKETRSALNSLWKYNFSPDAGAYFVDHKEGRKFVSPGDAGMIMCTFPTSDWDYTQASGGGPKHGGFAYYFNETWTGNEYQVASHMLWEGMLLEPMAMVRAIHDRYHPLKRNPWNEIECGSHYARAMASHGAFIGMCGFEHHGPLGHIGFAPRLTPEKFRGPFIAAEGWGTYAQTIAGGKLNASLEIKSGRLKLKTMSLTLDPASKNPTVKAHLNTDSVPAACATVDGRIKIRFSSEITIATDQKLSIEIV